MEAEKPSRFQFPAEILPENDRTKDILARREAEDAIRRQQEEDVSTSKDS